MTKKAIVILCLIAVLFSTEIKAEEFYNNEEKVTRISDVAAKELYTIPAESFGYGSYIPNRDREYIIKNIGSDPYWRKGKENIDYAIYKTDATHYLILTSYEGSFLDRWYVSKITSKTLFEKYVKIGTSIDVVKLIDSDATDIINGAFQDYILCHHRFADGTYWDVHYRKNSKGDFIVERIDYRKDKMPVLENLLDIDYQLIKNNNPNEEKEFLEKLKKLNEKPKKDDVVKPIQKKPTKVKIQSVKRIKKKSIRIKFKKAKYAKKYQIQYASNKKFKKAKIKTTKKNYYTIKASGKKTYYIRVRGVNGTKKGTWSKIKKVKKYSTKK